MSVLLGYDWRPDMKMENPLDPVSQLRVYLVPGSNGGRLMMWTGSLERDLDEPNPENNCITPVAESTQISRCHPKAALPR